MNSQKTTIIVLVTLLVCSAFTIGYLIDKNFYIKVVNSETPTTEVNMNGLYNTKYPPITKKITTEDVQFPVSDTVGAKYEVKKGDTLDTIARLFNISKETIIKVNNLKTESVSVGDVLIILPMNIR